MGPPFGSSNASLIDDETYVSLIRDKYCTWISEEGRGIEDPRVLWHRRTGNILLGG